MIAAEIALALSLAAPSGWRVESTVCDAESRPIGDARVVVALRGKSGGIEIVGEERTDSAGRAEIDLAALCDERPWVRLSRSVVAFASAPGHRPSATSRAAWPGDGGSEMAIDLALERGAALRGRVFAPGRREAAGALVELLHVARGRRGGQRFEAAGAAIAGTDGAFVLPIEMAGRYVLRAQSKGVGLAISKPFEIAKVADTIAPDVALESGPPIEGTVRMPGGGPVAGVPIFVRRMKGGLGRTLLDAVALVARVERRERREWLWDRDYGSFEDATESGGLFGCLAFTGEDGRFRLTGLAPGRYEVEIEGTDPVEVATGARDVSLQLGGHWARIRVTDDLGNALPGVPLEVGPSRFGCMTESYESAPPDGIAWVPTRADYPQGVSPEARGYAPAREGWRATADALVTDVELVLVPESRAPARETLRVVVQDEDGTILRDGRLVLRRYAFGDEIVIEAIPDENGLVHDLRPGHYHATFIPADGADAYASIIAPDVFVRENRDDVVEMIAMRRPPPVESGRVRLTLEAPVPRLGLATRDAWLAGRKAGDEEGGWLTSWFLDPVSGESREFADLPSGVPVVLARTWPLGEWIVEIEAKGLRSTRATVVVTAGAIADVTLRVERD